MTAKEKFLRIMCTHTEMALATSTYSQPNIRIVNFYYDVEEQKIFFASFENKDKIREFEINPKVAFTTIPPERGSREHVKAKGFARRSRKTVFDVAEKFAEKVPDFKDIISQEGEYLVLFEISFEAVIIMLNFEIVEVFEMEEKCKSLSV